MGNNSRKDSIVLGPIMSGLLATGAGFSITTAIAVNSGNVIAILAISIIGGALSVLAGLAVIFKKVDQIINNE